MTKRTLEELIQAFEENRVDQPERVEIKYRLIFNKRGGILLDVKDGQWLDYYTEETMDKLIDDIWGLIQSCDPVEENWKRNVDWKPYQVRGMTYDAYCEYVAKNPNNYHIVEDAFSYHYEPFYRTEWDLVARVCNTFDRI